MKVLQALLTYDDNKKISLYFMTRTSTPVLEKIPIKSRDYIFTRVLDCSAGFYNRRSMPMLFFNAFEKVSDIDIDRFPEDYIMQSIQAYVDYCAEHLSEPRGDNIQNKRFLVEVNELLRLFEGDAAAHFFWNILMKEKLLKISPVKHVIALLAPRERRQVMVEVMATLQVADEMTRQAWVRAREAGEHSVVGHSNNFLLFETEALCGILADTDSEMRFNIAMEYLKRHQGMGLEEWNTVGIRK